tara:strand:- start:899 stop:2218 length:1320 start_codon:yes stop_codon:yes gene_type:complete
MALIQPHTLTTDAAAAVDVILTQEANRIGNDIHRQTMHTSPWIDLIKQSTFPEGMGYQLNTLVYDRSLPLSPKNKDLDDSGATAGLDSGDWAAVGSESAAADSIGYTLGQQDTTATFGSGKANVNVVDFTKTLKSYSLKRAVIESPRLNVEELRFAAHRTEQLRAIMDLLKEATRNSWENRYREEYGRLCDNTVICKASASQTVTGEEGTAISDIDVDVTADDGTIDISANISNKILDDIYFKLIRGGAGANSYGRENGRPVFSLVCSSEASYQLMTEAGFRDDVRYNNARVSELIAPLGVEKSFRGFYHLIDDLAPRFSSTLDGETLTDVPAFSHNSTTALIEPNADYETADMEAAFVLVDGVMESLIPAPITNVGSMKFDPINYKGEFKWTNIPDQTLNPDGSIGFFRGILASASKPIKTNFGYVILFKRTSTTPAA